ncbi:MAG TPA: hypothetical protein DCE42_29110 [Myxococcales bacterium]|nr:hypothetical protein [Myxococcales bacterium]
MSRFRFSLFFVLLGILAYSWSACSPPTTTCEASSTQECKCGDKVGKQTCNEDGSGFGACDCTGQGGVEKTTDENTSKAEASKEVGEERVPEPGKEPVVNESTDTDGGAGDSEPVVPETSVEADATPDLSGCDTTTSFVWQGKCYTNESFCTSSSSNSTFPIFSPSEQDSMQKPYVIEFDPVTKKPTFCQTKKGYFYLSSFGYGKCDNDNDGWINIFAYRAVTSTDNVLLRNARCELKKVQAVVYYANSENWAQHKEQYTMQVLKQPVELVETDRNDGLGKLIEMPIFTKDQAPLPTQPGSNCTADADCTASAGEVCYKGHCLVGRRFQPKEINTLTKACIGGLDLNDNQIGDAGEKPSDTPNPKSEFQPLLQLGYFVELQYAYFEKDFTALDKKRYDVLVLKERIRTGKDGESTTLAMKCGEDPNGFKPDYWRRCGLRDDQQCEDPNNPGKQRNGLSQCWMKDVTQAIPSLFKCVVFDSTTDKTTKSGFFHPDNYGMDKNYSRTTCNFKATWTNPDATSLHKEDILFECTGDDGKQKPDPSKKTVGWACVSFKPYKAPADYLAGCIDETAHEVCGAAGGQDNLTYLTNEKGSYGMTRAKRECGPKLSQGVCKTAEHVCTAGVWLACNACDNCPQDTQGQKTICPGGVWPQATVNQATVDSCKLVLSPSTEVCNGKDDDCDGSIDEGIATVDWYVDKDGDGFGDANGTVDRKCRQNPLKGYVDNKSDCNDGDKDIKPTAKEICDGIDNNCNGNVDDGLTSNNWYRDGDGDTFGAGSVVFKGCTKHDDPNQVCTGLNTCRSTTGHVKDNTDCCDQDSNQRPNQTAYFPRPSKCNSWNYNCKNGDEPNLCLKKCSRSGLYNSNSTATCSYDGWNPKSTTGNWFRYTGNKTFTNATSCELTLNLKLEPNNDQVFPYTCNFTHRYSCGFIGTKTCSTKETCRATGTVAKSTSSQTYAPKTTANASYIMWHKNNYNSGCYYKKDGSTPKCGDTVYLAGARDSHFGQNFRRWRKSSSRSGGGTNKCNTTHGTCGGFNYSCSYNYNITMNSDYYFTVFNANTSKIVNCR